MAMRVQNLLMVDGQVGQNGPSVPEHVAGVSLHVRENVLDHCKYDMYHKVFVFQANFKIYHAKNLKAIYLPKCRHRLSFCIKVGIFFTT
jgi:hypothetical protein